MLAHNHTGAYEHTRAYEHTHTHVRAHTHTHTRVRAHTHAPSLHPPLPNLNPSGRANQNDGLWPRTDAQLAAVKQSCVVLYPPECSLPGSGLPGDTGTGGTGTTTAWSRHDHEGGRAPGGGKPLWRRWRGGEGDGYASLVRGVDQTWGCWMDPGEGWSPAGSAERSGFREPAGSAENSRHARMHTHTHTHTH